MLKNKAHLIEDSYDGLKGHEAHIRVKPDAKPVCQKPGRVPYALREPVEAELQKLEENRVIKKVERSKWARPIVVVPKTDRSVRICGDYKVSIKPSVEDEQITRPTTLVLYVQMAGSQVFTKLDFSHTYAGEASTKFLTINTHKGLYAYLKLLCGVKCSPKIFQFKMDQILQDIPKCVCNQDDILIGGNDENDNFDILEMVLKRLSENIVHIKLSV